MNLRRGRPARRKTQSPTRDNMIEFLLGRRFPERRDVIARLMFPEDDFDDFDEGLGVDDDSSLPSGPEFDEQIESILPTAKELAPVPVEIESYLATLKSHSLSLLSTLYEKELDKSREFTKSLSETDMDYWLAKRFLSLEEATALSFRMDPLVANVSVLEKYPSSPFALDFRSRHDSLDRYAKSKKLAGLTPTQFAQWGNDMEITNFPAPSSKKSTSKSKSNDSAETDEMHHHTLDRYYQLLIAVCTKEFGYEPFGDNSRVPAGVNRYIAKIKGFDVSTRTLRKHLRDAEKHFVRKGLMKRKA